MTQPNCAVPDCERAVRARSLCNAHYKRWKKTGDPGPAEIRKPLEGQQCIGPDCETPAHARKMCQGHYAQWRKGHPLTPVKPSWVGRTLERDGDGNKQCRECAGWFPLSDYTRFIHSKDGLGAYCPTCRKRRSLRNMYQITLEQYEALLAKQGGVCAICGSEDESGKMLAVDHDHACCPGTDRSCGKCVRGLLCSACNQGIGKFRDDIGRLESAIAYLKR